MNYYCDKCERVLSEDQIKRPLVLEEVCYPNDDAHPAEYGEPECEYCGRDVREYACDACGNYGDADEDVLYVDSKSQLICRKCYVNALVSQAMLELHESIAFNLIMKFGFIEDDYLHEVAEEIVSEYIRQMLECRKNE